VLFPKTWQKTREQLTVGQIIIVEGKIDANSTPPKILVDEIRTEIKILESIDPARGADTSTPSGAEHPYLSSDEPEFDPFFPETQPSKPNGSLPKNIPVKPSIPPPMRQVGEKEASSYRTDSGFDDMPPPPDNFPDGWDSEWQPSFENAEIAARPEPKGNSQPAVSEPRAQKTEALESEIRRNEQPPVEAARETLAAQQVSPVKKEESFGFLPSLYITLAQEEREKDNPQQQITVTLRSTGDKEHDKRRIKTIFGTLISFHGRDRFSFQIFENGKGHLIDFPNDTTRVCAEVLDRLKKLIGDESLRVEEITFQ
jgi:hypothetical protein